MLKIYQQLVFAQRALTLSSHTYHRRKYTSSSSTNKPFLLVPSSIRDAADLETLFVPLKDFISKQWLKRQELDDKNIFPLIKQTATTSSCSRECLKEQMTQVGAKHKVKWTKEEVGDSGWRLGWYAATVQEYR